MVTPRIISSTATISCRPSTMKTPVPAENACNQRNGALHQRCEGHAEHNHKGRYQSSQLPSRNLQEYAQSNQHQRAQKLIGASEQRPDIGVAHLRQDIAEHQGNQRRKIFVAENLSPALRMFHIIHAEKLLEGHTSDPGHGIQCSKRQSGDAHGHEALGHIDRDAEHFQETGHAGGEDLERRSDRSGSIRARCGSCHAECDHCQQAFQNHGAITDLQHILFIGNRLGRCARGYQAVEAGYRAAGNRYEQDRKQISQALIVEAGESGKVHGRVCENQP